MDVTRDAHLLEYEKLKEEQVRRIHFRDNMRYVTLAAIGVVAAQAGKSSPELWLVIPWICAVLGWTYVANVHTVREIGDYIKGPLLEAVSASVGGVAAFGWETFRCRDEKYVSRRIRQLLVDEITFLFPGVIALAIFGLSQNGSVLLWLLAGIEALLCFWIGGQIYDCADESARVRLSSVRNARPRAILWQRSRVAFEGAGHRPLAEAGKWEL